MEIIDILVAEHRVIERMNALLRTELAESEIKGEVRLSFVYAAADFFKSYADETHHGKEEGILIRRLEGKPVSGEERALIARIAAEHAAIRAEVTSLALDARKYEAGDQSAAARLRASMKRLIAIYPGHIELEENDFFPAAMGNFSQEEKDEMAELGYDHDTDMAHKKYVDILLKYEGR